MLVVAVVNGLMYLDDMKNDIEEMLDVHFKSDEREFKALRDSDVEIFKKLDKIMELIGNSGSHMSFINLNLEKMESKMDTHIKRVEPMLLSYEAKRDTVKTLRGWGEEVKWWGGFFAAVSIVIGGLVWFVRTIIKGL